MESKLKTECMDAVGELPNLLLREGGYPHLPTTPIKKAKLTSIWLEEPFLNGFGAIRIDFSNDYHCRIQIEGGNPKDLAMALEIASIMVKNCDNNGML